jgi:hypothetical protein
LERDEKGMPERSIVASKAVWREDRWILSGGSARGFAEGGAGMPEPVASLETNLDPTALKLRRFGSYRNSLSFAQVSEMLAKRELLMDPSASRVDEWERIRYGRFGVALCNLLGVVICLPFFLRREPIVMIAQSLKAAPLAVGSLMGGVLGASAAIPALPPQVSVFIPAIILLPLAIASITSVRT